MTRIDGVSPGAAAPASEEARLRKATQQLEGVFVEQLFKAMRETVPKGDGILSGGSGEEMFSSLMDAHLAAEVPGGWERGMGAALYRQLNGALDVEAPSPTLAEGEAP